MHPIIINGIKVMVADETAASTIERETKALTDARDAAVKSASDVQAKLDAAETALKSAKDSATEAKAAHDAKVKELEAKVVTGDALHALVEEMATVSKPRPARSSATRPTSRARRCTPSAWPRSSTPWRTTSRRRRSSRRCSRAATWPRPARTSSATPSTPSSPRRRAASPRRRERFGRRARPRQEGRRPREGQEGVDGRGPLRLPADPRREEPARLHGRRVVRTHQGSQGERPCRIDLTTVGTRPALALRRHRHGSLTLRPCDSYQNESATAIEPGAPVARGTDHPGRRALRILQARSRPTPTRSSACRSATRPRRSQSSNSFTYPRYSSVPVKKEGRVKPCSWRPRTFAPVTRSSF
jgi:hypothetical protein